MFQSCRCCSLCGAGWRDGETRRHDTRENGRKICQEVSPAAAAERDRSRQSRCRCPPLGYDIDSRKFVVNAAGAKTVNLIFRRYLDLGCVRALRDDLADRRITSKVWTSTSSRAHGGTPFYRGALYCLLKNQVGLGAAVLRNFSDIRPVRSGRSAPPSRWKQRWSDDRVRCGTVA